MAKQTDRELLLENTQRIDDITLMVQNIELETFTQEIKDQSNVISDVELKFKKASGTASLNDYPWQEISALSASGEAKNVFKVGDKKKIHLEGTMGTLVLNTDLYVYILGFDHNGSKGIDFGTFKDESGNDYCLVDSNYNSYSENGSKYFNMNHSEAININGWQGCDLRYDILGSCKVKNQQNAPIDTVKTPVSNTLMSCLPNDLRQVMKPMTIWTDNKGGGTDTPGNVTTTIDYLPLLAEYEIHGTRSYANSTEQSHQTQYEYYKSGNSKVKKRFDGDKLASYYWCRSAYCGSPLYFCDVNTDGSASDYVADLSYGAAPVFRV